MKKISAIILFVVQALPIPVSILSLFGSFVTLAGIYMMNRLEAVLLVIFLLLVHSYLITYIISLLQFRKTKKLSFLSFLPLIHLTVTIMLYYLWIFSEGLLLA